MYSAGNAPRLN